MIKKINYDWYFLLIFLKSKDNLFWLLIKKNLIKGVLLEDNFFRDKNNYHALTSHICLLLDV